MINISKISTEEINVDTKNIDKVSTIDLVKMINTQDKQVAIAVAKATQNIAHLVDKAHDIVKGGGRIIYFGAGTSGRLGVLDASEIFPTFGEQNIFQGLIAGGLEALTNSIEHAEDDVRSILSDFQAIQANSKDFFIGISASGRTPYVVAGLKYANKINAATGSIATSKQSIISQIAHFPIEVVTGAESIAGSTRMKSGSAQKMVLNIISTGVMVKIGKTYSNLMVDVKSTNQKLKARAISIIKSIVEVSDEEAKQAFVESNENVKLAIIMIAKKLSKKEASILLAKNGGILRKIFN